MEFSFWNSILNKLVLIFCSQKKSDPEAGFNIEGSVISCLDMIEAGTETSASTLCWSLLFMFLLVSLVLIFQRIYILSPLMTNLYFPFRKDPGRDRQGDWTVTSTSNQSLTELTCATLRLLSWDSKTWQCCSTGYSNIHSKKCWVKYNPALGKIWINPAVGLLPRRLD